MVAERSVEQRNLQPVAYKNADGRRRASGRIITSVECAKGNEQQAIHAKEYAVNLEVELQKICDGILALMDEGLILSASTGEPREFCYEMKGDYYRFLADVSMVSQRQAPTTQKERKTVEVPLVMTQETVVPVTRLYPEYVDVSYANHIMQTVEETVEIPQVQYSDRTVDLPVVMLRRRVPTIQLVQETVDMLQVQFLDRVLDAPVVMQRQVLQERI